MQILIIDSYLGGSHKQWAEAIQHHSKHKVEILGLPSRHWKWRMEGGAIELAHMVNELDEKPDIILCTSMVDLPYLKSSLKVEFRNVPIMYYMHENQLTYPKSQHDTDLKEGRDFHYGFMQLKSCFLADKVVFNSEFHKTEFLNEAENLVRRLPDYKPMDQVQRLRNESEVLYVGIDQGIPNKKNEKPIFAWNHRWEYDKDPLSFFEVMQKLKKHGLDFGLVILGEERSGISKEIQAYKENLKDRILHWGYVNDRSDYYEKLSIANILPVTSKQEFFGISVMEAVQAGLVPLLPQRLVYPEHFGEGFIDLFYQEGELFSKLHWIVEDGRWTSFRDELIKHSNKYLWNSNIEHYDRCFESMLS